MPRFPSDLEEVEFMSLAVFINSSAVACSLSILFAPAIKKNTSCASPWANFHSLAVYYILCSFL